MSQATRYPVTTAPANAPALVDGLAANGSRPVSFSQALQRAGKRMVDFSSSGLGLLCLLPLFLLIAAVIRADSRGPVFYRQRRLGRGGKPFDMWKFRTMTVDAEVRQEALEGLNESKGGVLFKIHDDPRVTRVGRLLRRTSLDELPQLLNVLLGEMSLVGPRPLPLRDSLRLQQADGVRSRKRLEVLPGLTGPWQLGGRSDLGYEEMLDLDLAYIQGWSLRRDLEIIVTTTWKVVLCRGAC